MNTSSDPKPFAAFNEEQFLEGMVLFFDKAVDWSSFDLVKKVRSLLSRYLGLRKIKVGHAGTLDPLASGLMIICTGKATKRIQSFQDLDKTYEARFRLGQTTPSYDMETKPDRDYPVGHITQDEIREVLSQFLGESLQVPPIFSAKRIEGKRAYDYARAGEELKMRPALIRIDEMELLEYRSPDLSLRIRCSKGTYIRSLARDLGAKLNSGAYLSALRRTGIGHYRVEEAISIEKFEEKLKYL